MLLNNLDLNIKQALSKASYAPSSHNCQPWEIVLVKHSQSRQIIRQYLSKSVNLGCFEESENYLILCLNQSRSLTALDSHELEMLLSCGAFLESLAFGFADQNIRTIALWHNDSSKINPLPNSLAIPFTWIPLVILILKSVTSEKIASTEIEQKATLLTQRITNRGVYDKKPLAPEVKRRLVNTTSLLYPDIHRQCNLSLIEDAPKISQIGSFFERHAQIEFTASSVWQETYKYIRFGDRNLVKDGLPVSQLFGEVPSLLKSLLKILLSPIAMSVLKHLGLPRLLAAQMGQLVAASPAVVYFNFQSDKPSVKTQLAGGALWLNFCLNATMEGLSIHPMSVILQHPYLRSMFQQTHKLPSGRGFFFCRIGQPLEVFNPAPKRLDIANNICIL